MGFFFFLYIFLFSCIVLKKVPMTKRNRNQAQIRRPINNSDIKLVSILLRSIIEVTKSRFYISEKQILHSEQKGSRSKERVICRALLCIKVLEHLEKTVRLKDIATLIGFPEGINSPHSNVIYYRKTYKEYNPLDSWNVEFFAIKALLEDFLEQDFEYQEYLLNKSSSLEINQDLYSMDTLISSLEDKIETEKFFTIEQFAESIRIDQYGDESSKMRIDSLSKMLVDFFERQKPKDQRYKYRKNSIPVPVIKMFLENQRCEDVYIQKVLEELDRSEVKIF